MTKVIAVFNAGSSSLKFSFYCLDDLTFLHKGAVNVADNEEGHKQALNKALEIISSHKDGWELHVAGHRVVHGRDYTGPVSITPAILAELRTLIPLAPLHQPYNLRIIEELATRHPGLPQIACFDTAFHRTQSKLNSMFALPRHFYDEGIKRYGFHGLSYEYIASQLPHYLGEKAYGRVVIAHLGNGASMCAMHDLKSQASSMGFSALDGLMMGTRSGTIDPGVVLYMQHLGMSEDDVEDTLYHKSGLLGVSGITHDMRRLEESKAPEATQAIDLFCHMAAKQLGSLIAVVGGLDALVFTGGIGEHSSRVRQGICAYFGWMGITLDEARNKAHEKAIHASHSTVNVHVITTDEEIIVARACR